MGWGGHVLAVLPSPGPGCPSTSLAWIWDSGGIVLPQTPARVGGGGGFPRVEWRESCWWEKSLQLDISGSLVPFLEMKGVMLHSNP